jgi:Protein of unknown function (DUF2975)
MSIDARTERLFVWMDRAFWLIWLAFPVLIWLLVSEVLAMPQKLAELSPDLADCLATLPQLANFSPLGRTVFWVGFAAEFAVYAVVLGLAHLVIHRCALGRALFDDMIRVLRWIGIVIAGWSVAEVVLANLLGLAMRASGDVPVFDPVFTLDLPVLGVGLLIVALSLAMGHAVRLREDADLTI